MAASTTVQDIGDGRVIIADQVHPSLQIVYDADLGTWHTVKSDVGRISTTNYVWDTGLLQWARMTQPSGGGGGGGAVTIADGADVVAGTTTDAAIVTDADGTISGKLRGLVSIFANVWNSTAGRLRVEKYSPALTASSPASVSVGIASASAIAANASRKGLVIVNLSEANVSFGIGVAATLSSGITLTPFGVWTMDDYTFSLAEVFAIASAAASTISVQEYT
jgi:hypothetical protein